jgi:hypothetical protein
LILALALTFAGLFARAQTADAAPAAGGSVLQTPSGAAPRGVGLGQLHGHITDPSGALIPGAQVVVIAAQGGPVGKATADAAGAYTVRGLAAGSYVIQATFNGFAPFVSTPIPLSSGQIKMVDIKMAIEVEQQQVVVTDEGAPQVSFEFDRAEGQGPRCPVRRSR